MRRTRRQSPCTTGPRMRTELLVAQQIVVITS
ncbi:hypothetical protein F443_21434 [Phytophthora nicotianae P1569]|uniref:Uncharacterized protein n=1 Tax=Phytophthora nicotianae P1569 TaxID=1317065 RepID=V9DZ97_PHYNI|nr:hypothetical protein F443_21434 [Phytophthora nicotianae P1569]